jgi:hypothetical protein
LDLPQEEGEPAGEESRHDDAQCASRFPFSFHLATAGDGFRNRILTSRAGHYDSWYRVAVEWLLQGREAGADAVNLQVFVEQCCSYFAPATKIVNVFTTMHSTSAL